MPPEPIRQLRDLTRTRTAITRARTREAQRLEKVLEDAGIKLGLVATDITGLSGRRMLHAMARGERDPHVLADLAVRQLRGKIPALTEALTGRFTEHHAFLVETHLRLIDEHTAALDSITARIEEAMTPFLAARELLTSIPGIGIPTADVVIAETGADMNRFATPGHLASWAGVCPGHHESAGRKGSTKTRPGNRHLKGALGAAAMSIARHPGTFLNAKYRRLAGRRGNANAIVAIERNLLTLIWTALTTGALYDDPGPDYYTQRRPKQTKRHALRQLHELGYDVTLQPMNGAA